MNIKAPPASPARCKIASLAAVLALTLIAACGPDRSVPPSSGPGAPCPNGEHRIKDGWLDWSAQWVCQ